MTASWGEIAIAFLCGAAAMACFFVALLSRIIAEVLDQLARLGGADPAPDDWAQQVRKRPPGVAGPIA